MLTSRLCTLALTTFEFRKTINRLLIRVYESGLLGPTSDIIRIYFLIQILNDLRSEITNVPRRRVGIHYFETLPPLPRFLKTNPEPLFNTLIDSAPDAFTNTSLPNERRDPSLAHFLRSALLMSLFNSL